MICVARSSPRALWQLALCGVLVLSLSGCAPATESPNPWADFQPAANPMVIPPDPTPIRTMNPALDITIPVPKTPRGLAPPPAPPAEESEDVAVAEVRSGAEADVPAHWTGAVIYCQPGCVPCAMEIRDLKNAGWKCGVSDRNHFKLIELLTLADFQKRSVPSTPQTVFFIDGVEQPPRITGYGATPDELTQIVRRHPAAKRTSRASAAEAPTYGSPIWYDAPLCSAPVLANCSAPRLAQNCAAPKAAPDCGGPYVSTIYESAPIVTSVTYSEPAYAYSVPIAYRPYPSCGVAVGPATHSAQLSLFGFPLIGGSVGTTVSW